MGLMLCGYLSRVMRMSRLSCSMEAEKTACGVLAEDENDRKLFSGDVLRYGRKVDSRIT